LSFVDSVPTADVSGIAEGDYVELTSGWGRISQRIFKVSLPAGIGTIKLKGCDTSNTNLFPEGLGKGSIRKINTWELLNQKLTIQSNGGDPKIVNFSYVETGEEQSVFDGNSATTYGVDLDADSISQSYYASLKKISDAQTVSALKMTAPNGATLVLSCTISMNENPTMASGQIMSNKVTFYGRGRTVRYAALT
jgi:hypothetical protein